MAYTEDRWYQETVVGGRKERVPTSREKKGRRWRVRWVVDGRERSLSFDRKDKADQFRDTVSADLIRGNYIDPHAGKITLRTHGREWLKAMTTEATTREKTRERAEKHIFPTLGDYSLAQLSRRPSIIQSWLSGLELSDNYKRAILIHLSAMLQTAVDDGLISRNPCKVDSVRTPREPKRKVVPWDRARVEAVRAQLPERYQALTDAGAGLGLRQGEVFGLAADDIDWLRGIVHVRRQVRIVGSKLCFALPKGRRERDVPLPESVKLRLSAHLEQFPAAAVTLPWRQPGTEVRTATLIFTTSKRTALNRAYFGQLVWKPAVRAAGVIPPRGQGTAVNEREYGFHALRHHFASVLLASGVDVRKLSEYLGHHDPGFTLRVYGHFIPDGGAGMRAAIDALYSGQKGPQTAPAISEGP